MDFHGTKIRPVDFSGRVVFEVAVQTGEVASAK
jgi:hypothetical protein